MHIVYKSYVNDYHIRNSTQSPYIADNLTLDARTVASADSRFCTQITPNVPSVVRLLQLLRMTPKGAPEH